MTSSTATRTANHVRKFLLVQTSMFAALLMIGVNISPFLITGGVPITLQTFFAILAGLLLGKPTDP